MPPRWCSVLRGAPRDAQTQTAPPRILSALPPRPRLSSEARKPRRVCPSAAAATNGPGNPWPKAAEGRAGKAPASPQAPKDAGAASAPAVKPPNPRLADPGASARLSAPSISVLNAASCATRVPKLRAGSAALAGTEADGAKPPRPRAAGARGLLALPRRGFRGVWRSFVSAPRAPYQPPPPGQRCWCAWKAASGGTAVSAPAGWRGQAGESREPSLQPCLREVAVAVPARGASPGASAPGASPRTAPLLPSCAAAAPARTTRARVGFENRQSRGDLSTYLRCRAQLGTGGLPGARIPLAPSRGGGGGGAVKDRQKQRALAQSQGRRPAAPAPRLRFAPGGQRMRAARGKKINPVSGAVFGIITKPKAAFSAAAPKQTCGAEPSPGAAVGIHDAWLHGFLRPLRRSGAAREQWRCWG